jgi:hypothetical protein
MIAEWWTLLGMAFEAMLLLVCVAPHTVQLQLLMYDLLPLGFTCPIMLHLELWAAIRTSPGLALRFPLALLLLFFSGFGPALSQPGIHGL